MAEEEKSPNSPIVRKVGEAIYGVQVANARQAIDSLEFDTDDLEELFVRLVDESETAQILIFFSYLDDRIVTLMRRHLVDADSKTAYGKLFGLNGPISTFHARTLIAYHLGWLTRGEKRRLDAFRRVRNKFGHRAFKVSFKDKAIADLWSVIQTGADEALEIAIDAIKRTTESDGKPYHEQYYDLDDLPDERRRLCAMAYLASTTLIELATLPISRRLQVDPRHVSITFDEGPELLRSLTKASAAATLKVLQKPENPPT